MYHTYYITDNPCYWHFPWENPLRGQNTANTVESIRRNGAGYWLLYFNGIKLRMYII